MLSKCMVAIIIGTLSHQISPMQRPTQLTQQEATLSFYSNWMTSLHHLQDVPAFDQLRAQFGGALFTFAHLKQLFLKTEAENLRAMLIERLGIESFEEELIKTAETYLLAGNYANASLYLESVEDLAHHLNSLERVRKMRDFTLAIARSGNAGCKAQAYKYFIVLEKQSISRKIRSEAQIWLGDLERYNESVLGLQKGYQMALKWYTKVVPKPLQRFKNTFQLKAAFQIGRASLFGEGTALNYARAKNYLTPVLHQTFDVEMAARVRKWFEDLTEWYQTHIIDCTPTGENITSNVACSICTPLQSKRTADSFTDTRVS